MNKEQRPLNLLALKPKRNLEWETGQANTVVLVIPKFKNRLLIKWLVPMLAKPNIKVNLDERGSHIWRQCDGNTTVARMGEEMSTKFGEPLDSTYERIGKFVQQLARDKFVVLNIVE
ncbi:MAG: PqqD family protein [Bacteroidota bacterium]